MRILVTGGAGFIGSHLCETLLKEPAYEVICVDNYSTSTPANIEFLKKNPRFTVIKHDVVEPLKLKTNIDAIFHLASPASPNLHSRISYHALPMETMLVNTIGTLNLLKLAVINKARFVFASTSEVYGDPEVNPQPESYRGRVSTTGPRSVYDEAKRFGETLTAYFVRSQKLDARIARIFNTYGPRILKEDQRMLTNFIIQALSSKPITVYGDGRQTRSLCYVDDLVQGLLKLVSVPNLAGQIVNLGSPDEHAVSEYAKLVKKLTGSPSEIVYSETLPEDDPILRKPDIAKAKKLLNWQPQITLPEGLKRTINYYRRQ